MTLPKDYVERVYAGVLGKIIGVYLGRPFEGWNYERIIKELGEIDYYVHEKLKLPLIVTDDDIAGTFTFLRALPDYGNRLDITPAQIGKTWLNYLIEKRTILWWGGLGNSTEHTAYLRLKHGIPAPSSGSIAMNGKVVAEQIGAQIFIDSWAMVAPGNPDLAADLARRAASVSHDGEAIYGAQVLAVMESLAFCEPDLNQLLDTAVSFIPHVSVIYRMISDLREWHVRYTDWHDARQRLSELYGYKIYRGNCHIVPNHGLIHLALLYGDDNFQKSLMIVNTCGWDTDCNSGNVGCLLGIKNGLAGIDAGPDWRGPVADRLYIPSADGSRCITDAVAEAYAVINTGRALNGQPPLAPKNGARFNFELPGSVQGFRPDQSPDCQGVLRLENISGHSRTGKHSLAFHYQGIGPGHFARAASPTFIIPEDLKMPGYELLASPTLYSGQVVHAAVAADSSNTIPVTCRLYIHYYAEDDVPKCRYGPSINLKPGLEHIFEWHLITADGEIIFEIGLELNSTALTDGKVYLDYLTWVGPPKVTFIRPDHNGTCWRKTWVKGVDYFFDWAPESFRLAQNEGRGLLIQGGRDWVDYAVQADITPHMVRAAGLAARVQGMQRYYGLLLTGNNQVRLVKMFDGECVLAETNFKWHFGQTYLLKLEVNGGYLRAFIDHKLLFAVTDPEPFQSGSIALVCEEGCSTTERVKVSPLE